MSIIHGNSYKAIQPICGIYSITCTVNNKVYIGQSVDIQSRWKQHESGDTNKNLRKDLVRFGLSNFNFSIIEECNDAELDEREQYWIAHFMRVGKIYNILRPHQRHRQIFNPPSPFLDTEQKSTYFSGGELWEHNNLGWLKGVITDSTTIVLAHLDLDDYVVKIITDALSRKMNEIDKLGGKKND